MENFPYKSFRGISEEDFFYVIPLGRNMKTPWRLYGISMENFFHGNSTWAKTYENFMLTRRVP